MSEFSEGIKRDLQQRAEPVMRDLANDMASDWKDTVAVPVVGKGRKAVRSKPGEPPRMEHQKLIKAIEQEVTRDADKISATTFTRHKIHGYLETGTQHIAPRPSAEPLARRWFDKAVRYIGNALFPR